MNERENWLRTVEFRNPAHIPCSVGFSFPTWHTHRQNLEALILEHPHLFPDFEPGEHNWDPTTLPVVYRQGEIYTDYWGCTWSNIQHGLEGQVVGHPLADWYALEAYQMPDPLILNERGPMDWDGAKRRMAERKHKGQLLSGDGGRLFDRLYFLRGFENLMLDFATEPPELARLIERLEQHSMVIVQKWLEIGVDAVSFHTDIGTQTSLMISPAKFRMYIKPLYAHLFQTCRQKGVHVTLSSDGRLLEIVDDLIECGVSLHDPQLRANTLEGIARHYKGRLCAMVDLDRQGFPFMTPVEIRDEIHRVVDVMFDPRGGLMLLASVYGGNVALENITAICETLEEICFPSS